MIQDFKSKAEAIQNNIVELNKLFGSGQRGLAKTTQMFRKRKTIQEMLEAYTNDIETAGLYNNEIIMDYHGKLERNFEKLCDALDQDKSLTKSMKLLDGMAKQSQIQNQLRQEDFDDDYQNSQNLNNIQRSQNLNRSQNLHKGNIMAESRYIEQKPIQAQNVSQNYTNNQNNNTQIINYEDGFYPQQNINMVLKGRNQEHLNLSYSQRQQQQQQQQPQNQQYYQPQYQQPFGDDQPQTPGSRTFRSRGPNNINTTNRSFSRRSAYLSDDVENQYNNNNQYNYNNNIQPNAQMVAYQTQTRPTEMGDDFAYTEQEMNPQSSQNRKLKMLSRSNSAQQQEKFCQFGNCQQLTVVKCAKCQKWICEEHKFRGKKSSNAPKLNKYGVDMNKEFKSFCKKCSKRKRQYDCKYLEQTLYCLICALMGITVFVVVLLEMGIFDK
ncbi:hypothetical protein PPERSA_10697 [Pseudocohnilembus persalinus]|uniref:Uncharacterized protein n=1 Tax=Pseudocohnilembus persalinus TaxID=266149 RepID=A0A0V0QDE7_PSEPJ|nr:hypothetical protein PPERSA_10697 [Pseudocohnilembus persalinus]|eukprot:KRX00198.1 hypothetical protein PPERSA_10697 [Pseudocohnilembus persalinus]